MKFSKKIISVTFAALISSSAFAIDGFMHDAFIWIKSNVKDFSETTIRQNLEDGRLVNPSPLDLKVGDIFIDINGHAKQVKKITKIGNTITIDAETPEIYNVFDAVNIPEQTADFKKALDEKYENSESVSEERASEEDTKTTQKLLDALMPKPDHKLDLTITLPIATLKNSTNFDKQLKSLKDGALSETINKEQKQAVENLSQQIKNMAKATSTSASLKFPFVFRYTSRKNDANYSFAYASAGIDTHGTWKFWKWTTWYKPGYVNYNWQDDSEYGFSAGIHGVLSATLTQPLLYFGYPTVGPYFGLYFQLSGNISGGFEIQRYDRKMTELNAFSNFNFLFIPSNTNTNEKQWTPNIIQAELFVSGNGSVSLIPKFGLVALGINLVEANVPIALNASGLFGLQCTQKRMDEDNNFANIKQSINGTEYDKITDGFSLLADGKITFSVDVNLNLFGGIFSTNLFSFNVPLITAYGAEFTPGYVSPFESK